MKNYYELGNASFRRKDYMRAIEYYSIGTIIGENCALAKRNLGRIYFRLDRYDEALACFKELLNEDERFKTYALSMIATIHNIRGNYIAALEIMGSIPQSTNSMINQIFMLGYVYKYHKVVKAITRAESILRRLKTEYYEGDRLTSILSAEGFIYMVKQEYSMALGCFIRAFNVAITDLFKAKVLNDMAECYIADNDFIKAHQLLDQAFELLDDEAETTTLASNYKLRGILYEIQKDWKKAKLFLIKAKNIYRDKSLLRHLAEIEFYLANIDFSRHEGNVKNCNGGRRYLYVGAEKFARGFQY